MKEIEYQSWKRKDVFDFFKNFLISRYTTSVRSDVTRLYQFCKKNGYSFFLTTLYCFLRASNEIPEFRHRLMDDKIIDLEMQDASTALFRKGQETFDSMRIPYRSTLKEFLEIAVEIENGIKAGIPQHKMSVDEQNVDNVAIFSCIPWVDFTSFNPAVQQGGQSVPLITWGKMTEENGCRKIPYSLQVNHMFIDGYHIGLYVNLLENYFNHPEIL